MTQEDFYTSLEKMGVVPVVVLNSKESAAPLAHALVAGGLPSAEVTFRTPAAAESISLMREAEPDMLVGAGTVLTVEQAKAAREHGAQFIVSPSFMPDVVSYCLEQGIPVMPAGVTPTEVAQMRVMGLTVTKFFPAAQYGGLATINALAAVFPGHRFMPTGGVNQGNLAEYLGSPNIIACGGTWMAKTEIVDAGNFDEVERLSRAAAAIVASNNSEHEGKEQ